MPITVTCSCGKQLAAPDRLAGKRAKCPGCGSLVQIPVLEDTAEPADPAELQVLDDEAGPAGETPRPARPEQPDQPAEADQSPFRPGSYAAAVSENASKRAARAKRKRWTLFELAGIDVTVPRLLAPILLITAVLVWWFTGPADEADVVAVRAVQAIPALQGLEVREGYSLLTGQGDRSLGMKGPPLKNQPTPPQANPQASTAPAGPSGVSQNVAYSVGGGDQLMILRPDDKGDSLYVDLWIAQHLIEAHSPKARHKIQLRQREFQVKPVGGGAAIKPKLLFTRFDKPVTLDLAGADSGNYRLLLPPGVPPSRREGSDASGTVHYTGENTVTGEVTYQSFPLLSNMPAAVQGMNATGKLKLEQKNMTVNYQYNGGAMRVTPTGGTAWWAAPKQLKTPHWHPWVHYRVGVLLDISKSNANAWQIHYGPKHIATVYRPDNNPAPQVASAQNTSNNTGKNKQKKKQSKLNPVNAPGAYLSMLHQAQEKAKGTVAMSRMRQFGVALQTYIQQHNQWPDALEALKSEIGESAYENLMRNPRTGKKPGFIYEKPAADDDPASTPVLWEKRAGTKYLDGAILYADGHIEGG